MRDYVLFYSCIISLNKQNLFDAWLHVYEYQNNRLRDACLAFSAENYTWLIEQEHFGMLQFDDFYKLLKYYHCHIDGKACFDSILAWRNLQRSPTPSMEQLKQLFDTIDWTDLAVTDLIADLDDRNLR